ncbi:dihydrolipoyl dehydrogenase family protein [Capillimicrobium parvum]|uniref:Mercuric reductase n=1 Tax=Capillimicrobium parvum TaxID=2884022 RepID=A0A9E6XXF9_9ACTN|nr:NAD(P)/FAD-dependent oxidoreductase [Capillimicrobium parvum]UGS36170.1 Mercuric reductase [Capillimicrobium parvum]
MTSDAQDTWDVIVVGGGAAGENAAQYAAMGGLRVALVEAELLGGECSYWACMPSKALLRPVELMAAGRAMAGVEQALAGRSLHLEAVLARRDRFTHGRDDGGQVEWAAGAGLELLRGEARLDGERTVVLAPAGGDGGARRLRARHAIVLATGTSAAIPPVEGLAGAHPWTSRDVTNLTAVPERVLVIGGGVVACEAATWLVGLGAQVTIVEVGPALLARDEPFAGELVAERFREAGVDVRLGASIDSVRRDGAADTGAGVPRGVPATIVIDGEAITVDEIVVAAGRRPRTDDLGLETVGLEAGGYLDTDDHLAVRGVGGDWLYAVGDVTGRALLTHMGKYHGRVCGDVIAARAQGRPPDGSRHRAIADHGRIPQVTFTDPEVASVGLTAQEAREQHAHVETVDYDIAAVAGASLLRDDYAGQARLVIDADRDVLLGATFAGHGVAELLHSATVAVVGEVPLDVLWHAVPSYPTASEVWLRLLEARRNR